MESSVTMSLKEHDRLRASNESALNGLKDNVHVHITQYNYDNTIDIAEVVMGSNDASKIIESEIQKHKDKYDELKINYVKYINDRVMSDDAIKKMTIWEFIKYRKK